METSTRIDTSLGRLVFFATVNIEGGKHSLELIVSNQEPQLPVGYVVNWVKSVVLLVRSESKIATIKFGCTLEADVMGGSECGQYLDAQSWESDSVILMVGTEDGDGLLERIPNMNVPDEPMWLVSPRSNGFDINLTDVPCSGQVSLHFLVAENDVPEKFECSAWYAVDIPHRLLLKSTS